MLRDVTRRMLISIFIIFIFVFVAVTGASGENKVLELRDQYYFRGAQKANSSTEIKARAPRMTREDQSNLDVLHVGYPYPWTQRALDFSDWISRGLLGTIQRPVKHLPTDYNKWTFNNSILITYSPLRGYFQMLRAKGLQDLRVGVIHLGDRNCTQDVSWYGMAAFVLRDHNCDSALWTKHKNVYYVPSGWKNTPLMTQPSITPQTIAERMADQSHLNWTATRTAAFALALQSSMNLVPTFGRRYAVSFIGEVSPYRSSVQSVLKNNDVIISAFKLTSGTSSAGSQQSIFYYGTLSQTTFSPMVEFYEPTMPQDAAPASSSSTVAPGSSSSSAAASAGKPSRRDRLAKSVVPKNQRTLDAGPSSNSTRIESYEMHRLWEVLESGAIPITLPHEYLKILGDAPFVMVKRWKKQFVDIFRAFDQDPMSADTRFQQISAYVWWKMYVFELNETVRTLVDLMIGDVQLVPFSP